mgnify:CR=1 FL=1|tara:strand:- start:1889 stop:2620 length:732 start_codon:yes stop_codon:yes gene_type:complete
MRYNVTEYADLPLYGLPVAVIDFETTGIDPYDSRAVEMAIVHLELGKGNARVVYKSRFNPGLPIPEGASSIHGIKDEDVTDCPSFGTAIEEINPLLEGRVLAAYNLPFDWTILNCEHRRNEKWHPTCKQRMSYGHQFFGLCGLVMARSIDNGSRGKGYHKLSSVCERRGISLTDAHSADADSLATAQLLELLLKEVTESVGRFPTVRDFWAWQRSEAMHQERGLRDWLNSKGIKNDIWPWTDY